MSDFYGLCFFFSSRRRHTRSTRDWSSDVCSSDLSLSNSLRVEQMERSKRFEAELLGLRQERDELNAKLATEQQTASDSTNRTEELESRLGRNATEFERAKAELEKQSADRERSESEWRAELNNAKARKEKLEKALAEAMERNQRLAEELAGLQQNCDELKGKLATEKLAATESRRQAQQWQSRQADDAAE